MASLGETELAVLSIGKSMEWPAPGRAKISVSNGSIVRVTDLGERVKIVARKIGNAEIRSANARLYVYVVGESDRRLHERLRSEIGTMRGPELGIEGKSVVVRGRILRFDDWLRLARVSGEGEARFKLLAESNPELEHRMISHMGRVLRDAHLPELQVQLRPSATITVPAEPTELKAHVQRVAGHYGFDVATSGSAISLEPMVRVRLIVAEFRRVMRGTLGITWPDSVNARLLPNTAVSDASSLALKINASEENGHAKVLASPTLLCRSGKAAQFLAGGEIPMKVASNKSRDVVWKQYGILLRIRPKADFSGRMSIGIESEVSMPDSSITVDGIPGMLTNRIETHFDLTSSRTIVLSGLIKKEWGESMKGLPVLSRIPILGHLFGNRDYVDNRTELVVFVTPELARPESEEL